jgi:hypothetical protein
MTTRSRSAELSAGPRLTGRWLLAARLVWAALAALGLAVFAAALPLRYAQYGAPPAALRAALDSLGLPLGAYTAYMTGVVSLFPLTFLVVAAAIAWRKSDDPMGLVVSLFLILVGTANEPNTQALVAADAAWFAPARLAFSALAGGFALLLFTFPDGRVAPRWLRLPLGLWLAAIPIIIFNPDLYPTDGAAPTGSELILLTALAGIPAQIYRYIRVSGPTERQQTKWVIAGLAVAPLGFMVAVALHAVVPIFAAPELRETPYDPIGVTALSLSFSLIPLTLGLAILRYRLWEIDLLINRALVYGTLTGALLMVYVGGVILLQGLFRALVGQDSDVAIVAATLAVAALFLPLRRRIQAFIDRRFYRRKYDATRTLAAYGAALRDDADVEQVSAELLGVVHETMRPAHAALWLRTPEEGR